MLLNLTNWVVDKSLLDRVHIVETTCDLVKYLKVYVVALQVVQLFDFSFFGGRGLFCFVFLEKTHTI